MPPYLVPVLTTLLRHLLTLVGGILVTKGFIDQTGENQLIDQLVGVVLAAAPAIWAMIRSKVLHQQLADAGIKPAA